MSGHLQKNRLTLLQRQVLDLLTVKGCWPAEVSRRLKISKPAVSKHITALRKMGFLGSSIGKGVNYRCTPQGVGHNVNLLRLHAEQLLIKLIISSNKYDTARLRASSVSIDGNRVVFYRDSIVVFSYQSFYGVDALACDAEASAYWVRFLHRLENLYGVLLLKERKENFKRVKAHYAEMNNELARGFRKKNQSVRFFGSKDGKEWLVFDDSKGLDEMEATHTATVKEPREAREDIELMQAFFNDLRDHPGGLPSDQARLIQAQGIALGRITSLLEQQATLGVQTAASVQAVAMVLESLLKAQNPGSGEPAAKEDAKKPDYFG